MRTLNNCQFLFCELGRNLRALLVNKRKPKPPQHANRSPNHCSRSSPHSSPPIVSTIMAPPGLHPRKVCRLRRRYHGKQRQATQCWHSGPQGVPVCKLSSEGLLGFSDSRHAALEALSHFSAGLPGARRYAITDWRNWT